MLKSISQVLFRISTKPNMVYKVHTMLHMHDLAYLDSLCAQLLVVGGTQEGCQFFGARKDILATSMCLINLLTPNSYKRCSGRF